MTARALFLSAVLASSLAADAALLRRVDAPERTVEWDNGALVGFTNATELIQKAIDDVFLAGGGRVVPGRRTMATFFLYLCDYSMPVRHQPGNIVVRNCTVKNAARFVRYNYGGEVWQHARPLADIRFENVCITGVDAPLVRTWEGTCELRLKNVSGAKAEIAAGKGRYECPMR